MARHLGRGAPRAQNATERSARRVGVAPGSRERTGTLVGGAEYMLSASIAPAGPAGPNDPDRLRRPFRPGEA
jgi:hypothetical protein